jgi:hypothetical protein
MCALSGFPTLFTLDGNSVNLQLSQTLLGLGFHILLLLGLIFLAFSMLILRVVGLTERALQVLVIFLDLLLFIGLLANNLLLHNPPPWPSM